MFLIQEKKINFLYIKLNTSCVRSAPHPLYSASCRCSSRAVASASHHLPPTPPLSIPPFSPFNPASKALLLRSYLPPLSVLVLFTLSSNLSQQWAPIPLASPPKHHHRRSFPLISNDTEGDTVKSPLPGVFGNFFPVLSTSGAGMNKEGNQVTKQRLH